MADVSNLFELAGWAVALLAYLEAKKSRQGSLDQVHSQILSEVIGAAEKTQTYLLKREKGQEQDFETEWELAEIWSRLSFSVQDIDEGLSMRLHQKSRIWRNRQEWDRGIRATKNLSLDSVIRTAHALR